MIATETNFKKSVAVHNTTDAWKKIEDARIKGLEARLKVLELKTAKLKR